MSDIETAGNGDASKLPQGIVDQNVKIEEDGTVKAGAPIATGFNVDPIEPDLLDKLAALKSIVMIDKLLQNGIFPGGMASDVMIGVQFLKNLHGPIMKEAQAHKDFLRATNPEAAAQIKAEQEKAAKAEAKRARKAKKSEAN